MNESVVIDVKNLSKSFGKIPAVQNVQLQVKKGEIFGFLGPNGSGKTTTLRMLCGLLKPDSGTGNCLSYNILTESLRIKKHVGYMTQRFSYYEDLTVIENLEFTARVFQVPNATKRIRETIEEFDFVNRKNQMTGNLSGGWKQRLALAAALLHQPALLLLDEPTAGVDPEARRQFWDKINELSAQGITTLVSTHYMDEAERCTRLAYIAEGHLLEQGTPEQIIRHVGLSTYKIHGEEITSLYHQLKISDKKLLVVMFGENLHVSSNNALALESTIDKLKKDNRYKIEKIETNLEDVFIHLIESARYEKHQD